MIVTKNLKTKKIVCFFIKRSGNYFNEQPIDVSAFRYAVSGSVFLCSPKKICPFQGWYCCDRDFTAFRNGEIKDPRLRKHINKTCYKKDCFG